MSASLDRAALYRIFATALELPASERDAFLDSRCGGVELRSRVARLLALAETSGTASGRLRLAEDATEPPDRVGCEYGPFRLLERLGIGGMGAVYRAERTDGVPQIVAVKILRAAVTAATRAQFLREARILARLEHPSIARLIDVGIERGEGWIAMEFVRGQPITSYCESRILDVPARVRLLISVADAIVTAHRALVVHRDIKPNNVLVTDEGQPKLIDFGIAYALARPSEAREATTDVRRLFTPHYAAPEQVRGELVTVATDVFGLGALAYRVLSGAEPFARATSAVGYLLSVTQEDADLPSDAARATGADAGLVRRLRGDLDCILGKALARDPARRYAAVEELQADLQSYLDGRPVLAHAPSLAYRLAKFARRRAVPVSIVGALLLTLLVSGTLYLKQERRVGQAQQAAARRDAFLEGLLKAANPYGGQRDVTVASLLDRASARLEGELHNEPLVEASMLGLIAQTNLGLGRFREGHAANDRQLQILSRGGAGPLEWGKALTLRGELFRYESRWGESAAALTEAVARLEPLGTSAELCAALDNLAAAQENLQQLGAAEGTLRRELAIEKGADPQLQRQRMDADLSMSALLGAELGRYAEAAGFAAEAWQLAQRLLPAEDPDRPNMEDGYAVALRNTGRAAEAEPMFRDVISHLSTTLGPQHHDTLVAQLGLVNDLLELQRYAEAAQLAASVAHDVENTIGPDSWYALQAWNQYGLATCSDHDETTGLVALQRVSQTRRRVLPSGHRLIYSVDLDLGVCLMRLRRFAEAESTLLEVANGFEQTRGPTYRKTQQAYAALRDLYAALNRGEDSERWAAKLLP